MGNPRSVLLESQEKDSKEEIHNKERTGFFPTWEKGQRTELSFSLFSIKQADVYISCETQV